MPDLVYCDSSVWIAYWINTDKHHRFAHRVIDDAENGAYKICVTDLAIAETTHALRKIVIGAEKYTGMSTQQMNQLQVKIDQICADFLEWLENMEDMDAVIYPSLSYSLDEFYKETTRLLNQVNATDWIRSRPASRPKEYRYYGPGHWDIQHAIMALDLHCSTLYTADHGFGALEDMQEFAGRLHFHIN